MLSDFGLFGVAVVAIKPVTEGEALAFRHLQIARVLVRKPLEVGLSKWIGREQTVVAHVPRSRVARVARMIEDRDAHGLALHRAVIINPLGVLAPSRRFLLRGFGGGRGLPVVTRAVA